MYRRCALQEFKKQKRQKRISRRKKDIEAKQRRQDREIEIKDIKRNNTM
jgi:hypothetical protein